MKIHFLKCHGSGNDFVLIEQLTSNIKLTKEQERETAISFSDRKGIIGSDGLLLVNKPKNRQNNAEMTVYTPDGTEIPMCVNGVRCVGRFILEKYPGLEVAKIETKSGLIQVARDKKLLNMVDSYSVSPIEPIFIENISPRAYSKKATLINEYIDELSLEYKFSITSVYGPYATCFVEKIDENELCALGEKANLNKAAFPNGLNVSFVKIIDSNNIYVRTYERNGIGLSLSCSSAMVSAVYSLCYLGLLNYGVTVNVFNKGGLVCCTCTPSSAKLLGGATYVYEGDIDYDFKEKKASKVFSGRVNLTETMQYSDFMAKTKKICNEKTFLFESNMLN